MKPDFTINPDEQSPEFRAHLAERIGMARDLRNSVPVDQFFLKRFRKQGSAPKRLQVEANEKVRQYAAV